MLYALDEDGRLAEARPVSRAACPFCHTGVVAKCGELVHWHWAHVALDDCDPWRTEETEWHRAWKRYFVARGATVEVGLGAHRADVRLPDGRLIELQHSHLSPVAIREREAFYGAGLSWIWHISDVPVAMPIWHRRQFKWRRPSLLAVTRPLWFDLNDELLHVSLHRHAARHEVFGRVSGRVLAEAPHPLWWERAARPPVQPFFGLDPWTGGPHGEA